MYIHEVCNQILVFKFTKYCLKVYKKNLFIITVMIAILYTCTGVCVRKLICLYLCCMYTLIIILSSPPPLSFSVILSPQMPASLSVECTRSPQLWPMMICIPVLKYLCQCITRSMPTQPTPQRRRRERHTLPTSSTHYHVHRGKC